MYLSEAINGYELVDPRGRDLPRFEAGSHIELRAGGLLRCMLRRRWLIELT